ncbi:MULTISPECIES: hypothetical protein [Ferrimonas]|uniref:hypothetical protein n=1 Tax=Ferrimonas TaxID=44011 RepID=UPI0004135419|nr:MULTISPECIES: hypothetical protein [Ferrimonas]USD35856.1 hypothetical protein J8Z22_12460 [Ferrimonas sp. SCSIO 43195]
MRTALMLLALVACSPFTQAGDKFEVKAEDFKCMLDMTPVRGFYVDNLDPHQLAQTVAIAEQESGRYPPGSVVQLVPLEVMVKQPVGSNPATNDWEFFELDVSADGTVIRNRGVEEVVNRFGGNCLECHQKARPEYDLICEQSHGCDPIPLTPQMTTLLQNTDPRCGGRYQPSADEQALLQQLSKILTPVQ